jgi:hypothetical protein
MNDLRTASVIALYGLYINGLPAIPPNIGIILFADCTNFSKIKQTKLVTISHYACTLFICIYLYLTLFTMYNSLFCLIVILHLQYTADSNAGPIFPTSYKSWYIFVFIGLWWGVIVSFIDIGGIVDHHFLSFLIMSSSITLRYKYMHINNVHA